MAYKKRPEKDPKNPQKRLSLRDVRGAKDVMRKAKWEAEKRRAVTRAGSAVPEAKGPEEIPKHGESKLVEEEEFDGGEQMVLPIIGGRR